MTLRQDISRVIRRSLTNIGLTKNSSVAQYLSYTIQELKEHLENQFDVWMSWNNQGKYITKSWDDNDSSTWTWHIDHIIPQSNFDFSNGDDIRKCWALNNLRPYSAKHNVIENDRK